MPYIIPERREDFSSDAEVLDMPQTPGELTYIFFKIAKMYVEEHGLSFATIADVLAALSATDKEFYRRVAAPYEDRKIEENGDVT